MAQMGAEWNHQRCHCRRVAIPDLQAGQAPSLDPLPRFSPLGITFETISRLTRSSASSLRPRRLGVWTISIRSIAVAKDIDRFAVSCNELWIEKWNSWTDGQLNRPLC